MKRFALLLLAVLSLLAACGDDDEPSVQAAGSADVADDPHNEADVTFAQGMIPHHAQAVEMARLADDRAGSGDVKELAAEIEAAQDLEVETMTGWLEAWGEDATGDMVMEGMGMMSDEQMVELEEADGTAFDRLFLELMTEHHTGAIDMALTEIAEGEFPDAVSLAEEIERTQTAEVARMDELLAAL